MKKYLPLFIILLLLIPGAIFADVIYLKSGGKIEGIIEKETDTAITITLDIGTAAYPKTQIESLSKSTDEENAKLKEKWKAQKQQRQAEQEERRKFAEEQEAKGLIFYEGRWITKAEYEELTKSKEEAEKEVVVKKKEINLIPITLKEGMEGPRLISGSLEDRSSASKNKVFVKNNEEAQKAGVDLFKELNKYYAVNFKNGHFFLLFYNSAIVTGCEKEYLLQRVHITKQYLSRDNEEIKPREELFLVEALKLKDNNKLKRADEHRKRYSIGKAFKRKIIVECEIGWGKIPNKIEGNKWPFEKTTLYHCIQDYSIDPDLYNKVEFDFSKKYTFEFEFTQDGKYSIELPKFLSDY